MIRIAAETPWYDLFSRGARDWLRHNQKVREAVRNTLPEILSGEDLLSGPSGNRTVLVPVKFLEHARFRLAEPSSHQGVGQGHGQPGEALAPERESGDAAGQPGGTESGEIRFVVEMKLDEIIDWIWEEFKLPELKPRRASTMDDPDHVREGWDKRGARSRLDRRRTLKEAVKRRAMQDDPVPIVNEDLRFRQLVKRTAPSTSAVVIFALDVSGSMDEAQRKLAKQFFFFALHGIRRRYAKVETVFLAHAAQAWEFAESQFFQASSSGGTVSSSVFLLARDVVRERYDPASYNVYFFYASDGENATDDRDAAAAALKSLAAQANYSGYVETGSRAAFRPPETPLAELFNGLKRSDLPVGMSRLSSQEDVWQAIRDFFQQAESR
jgi:uncharacterized protein